MVLLSVPMFDTLRVFGLRIIRGKSPFSADRIHMHHLLVDNGFSHLIASFIFRCAKEALAKSNSTSATTRVKASACNFIMLSNKRDVIKHAAVTNG